MQTPGIAEFSAVALSSRINGIERFKRPRSLANYFGLTPGCRNSGEKDRIGKITKAGSARPVEVEVSLPGRVEPMLAIHKKGTLLRPLFSFGPYFCGIKQTEELITWVVSMIFHNKLVRYGRFSK